MPETLQLISGLFYGLMTGAVSVLLLSIVKPELVCEFGRPYTQIAGGVYMIGAIFAFLGGQTFRFSSIDKMTLAKVGLGFAAAVISAYFGAAAPSCVT